MCGCSVLLTLSCIICNQTDIETTDIVTANDNIYIQNLTNLIVNDIFCHENYRKIKKLVDKMYQKIFDRV